MRIHREGHRFLAAIGVMFGLAGWTASFQPERIRRVVYVGAVTSYTFLLFFFRNPVRRRSSHPEKIVISPASGTILAAEIVFESEYFQAERLKLSIFLSVFNVHMNIAPIDGIIRYRQYHSGRYLVAFHSKASDQNERSTLVIETSGGELILVRQIAGAVARRISTYPNVGNLVLRGDEIGFIKFGSRVDVFLPLNVSLLVKVGDKVRVGLTPLATLDAQNI